MEMSQAALPARRGRATPQEEMHPLYPLYVQYRASMARQLVDSSDFSDWLYQYTSQCQNNEMAKHPRFKEFQDWMRDNQGGRRPCNPSKDFPDGMCFPGNFQFWLDGGRW